VEKRKKCVFLCQGVFHRQGVLGDPSSLDDGVMLVIAGTGFWPGAVPVEARNEECTQNTGDANHGQHPADNSLIY